MSSFNDRQKMQENKYAFDQETEFKAMARRNKLLGLWVAEHLHIEGEEAQAAYAKEVVLADFEEPGDEDVFRKVWGDLQEKGIQIEEEDVREKMLELYGVAAEQVKAEA